MSLNTAHVIMAFTPARRGAAAEDLCSYPESPRKLREASSGSGGGLRLLEPPQRCSSPERLPSARRWLVQLEAGRTADLEAVRGCATPQSPALQTLWRRWRHEPKRMVWPRGAAQPQDSQEERDVDDSSAAAPLPIVLLEPAANDADRKGGRASPWDSFSAVAAPLRLLRAGGREQAAKPRLARLSLCRRYTPLRMLVLPHHWTHPVRLCTLPACAIHLAVLCSNLHASSQPFGDVFHLKALANLLAAAQGQRGRSYVTWLMTHLNRHLTEVLVSLRFI